MSTHVWGRERLTGEGVQMMRAAHNQEKKEEGRERRDSMDCSSHLALPRGVLAERVEEGPGVEQVGEVQGAWEGRDGGQWPQCGPLQIGPYKSHSRDPPVGSSQVPLILSLQ